MSERAVSDVVGFVFAFALVTATVGSVYTVGFAGLQDAQRGEQVNNAERAFDVLADNLADVHQREAPSRATEISLGGASLAIGEPITVTVRAENAKNSSENTSVRMNPRPLVFSGISDSTLVYVAGAVVRTDGDASLMSVDPDITVDDRTAVIPFVHTYPRGETRSLSGDKTVLVEGRQQNTKVARDFETTDGEDVRVNITVESPRATSWGRYFEDQGFVGIDEDPSDGNVTYGFTTERVYVTETTIELRLRS